MIKMMPIPILDATEAQRRLFATEFLGLDLDHDDGDDAVFAKILAANGNSETIYVPPPVEGHDQSGTAPVAPATIEGRMEGSLGRDDPKVKLLIQNEDRNGEVYSRDKEVGVNGVVWLIQRNKPVDVPYRVYEALTNAVRDSVTHDPNTHAEYHTPVQSVPMSVMAMPPQAEIDAWKARTNDTFCP